MATPQKDWKTEWEAISKQSRKLAKRANQRLVRIEKYSKRPGMSAIKEYAYAKAKEYINTFVDTKDRLARKKKDLPRFEERIKLVNVEKGKEPTNEQYKKNVQLQRLRIKAMEEFLGSQSSTLGQSRTGPKTLGIKKIYDKRAQTITDKFLKAYGMEMSANDLKRFFDSKKQAKLETIVGSNQMFIVAAIIRKENIKGSRKELEEYVKKHVQVKDPSELDMKPRESRAAYLDRLKDKLNYTDDKILNQKITNALKEGINAKNIFIN